jgi:hypothetical protein
LSNTIVVLYLNFIEKQFSFYYRSRVKRIVPKTPTLPYILNKTSLRSIIIITFVVFMISFPCRVYDFFLFIYLKGNFFRHSKHVCFNVFLYGKTHESHIFHIKKTQCFWQKLWDRGCCGSCRSRKFCMFRGQFRQLTVKT